MDTHAFDGFVRQLAAELPRRSFLLSALYAAGVLGGTGRPAPAAAKKRRKRKNRKKIRFNEFGCVNVGMFCQTDEQCCSGICAGKKSKKRCRAHDTSTCQAGQVEEGCGAGGGGASVSCVSNTGEQGLCDTTTGRGAFCAVGGDCFPCLKDADCVPLCGPQAACILCSDCIGEAGTGTVCVGPSLRSCSFPG